MDTIVRSTMNLDKLLIFDLDDTIFETRSIGTEHLKKVFAQFRNLASGYYSSEIVSSIEKDLWSLPFDQVALQHQFPTVLRKRFSSLINETRFSFKIRPYPDFECIRKINYPKVLVTTGFRHLQQAKIAALDIDTAFQAIHIDEIEAPNRIYKSGIFEKIVIESGLNQSDHIVIGDNPESELKAGRELGLLTVQVARFRQRPSPYTDHYITHFNQLLTIINDEERESF